MANIQVTASTLTKKAEELKGLNNKFKSQVENLTSTENGLNGMWEGEAKEAFHKAFTGDIQKMNKFYDAIEKYVQALTQIAKEYEKAEMKNKQTATSRTAK